MTKKQKARKLLNDTEAKVEKLSNAKFEATEAASKAREAYLAVVQNDVVAELRTLEWERFKGRGSKGRLRSTVPDVGALQDLRELFSNLRESWWRRLQFRGRKDCALLTIEFVSGDYSNHHKYLIYVQMDSLRLLGIVPAALDKKLRRAARKVVDDAGLSAEELEAAITAFKGKG